MTPSKSRPRCELPPPIPALRSSQLTCTAGCPTPRVLELARALYTTQVTAMSADEVRRLMASSSDIAERYARRGGGSRANHPGAITIELAPDEEEKKERWTYDASAQCITRSRWPVLCG